MNNRDLANQRVLQRLYAVVPQWVAVRAAHEALALPMRTLLHAGPPFIDARQPSAPVLSSAVLCCLYEGWAQTPKQAERMIREGDIVLHPAQAYDTVLPLAAVISPRSHLVEVRDAGGGRCWSLLSSGAGSQLRFGSRDLRVLERLAWCEQRLAPALARVLVHGPIDLLPLAVAGLQQGDDLHSQTTAATLALLEKLNATLVGEDVRAVLAATPLFFLTLWMAACHLMLNVAANNGQDPASTLVVALAGNGQQMGIRVAGQPARWFVQPAHVPEGPRLAAGTGRVCPMLGDSGVIDAAGFGAQAWGRIGPVAESLQPWLPAAPGIERWMRGVHPQFAHLGLRIGLDATQAALDTSPPQVAIAMLDAAGQQGLLGRGICATPAALYTLT